MGSIVAQELRRTLGMLRPRIIPCLLVRNNGLVKTVRFKDEKYLGDPINAVRIFNEKEADELIILDIDATSKQVGPDFRKIEHWAAECRMPLCYGGGVTTLEQAKTIIGVGVEKVALSAAVVARPSLVSEIAGTIGSQSVVAVLDVRKTNGRHEIWTHNGKRNTGMCPIELSKQLQGFGIGEIVLNSIDQDGVMKGYDLELVARVREQISVPMSVLGGAGSLQDIGTLFRRFGVIGAAAGSLFVFKGALKAVLINYPNSMMRETLASEARSQ